MDQSQKKKANDTYDQIKGDHENVDYIEVCLETYKVYSNVFIGSREFCENYAKEIGYEFPDDYRGAYYIEERVILIVRKDFTYAVLTHELLHFVINSMKQIGIPVNEHNDEVLCYGLQSCLEQCSSLFTNTDLCLMKKD